MHTGDSERMPFGWALFCILFLLFAMICSMLWLDTPIHVNLLTSISVTLFVAYLNNGRRWKPLSEAIENGGKICIQPTIIMMLIGAVIGSWIACGTVPMIIYWGLKLINPRFFLLSACVITAVVALAIGSSWSASGTIGVALMGIGLGLGVHPGMTAGAVISGAYLGDKMSPMSDTTNLASAVAEADLFDHIKSMMYTTWPSFALTLILYGVLGFGYHAKDVNSDTVAEILKTIEQNFALNPVVLLPALIVIVMAVRKCPSIPTLLVSILTAVIIAATVQRMDLTSIGMVLQDGFSVESGLADFDRLMNRGGIQSMMWTASLGILGMMYGSIMEKTGLLSSILEKIQPLARTIGGLIATVIGTCLFLLCTTASQTLPIVVGGRMFVPEFRKKDLLPQTLSRTLEDGTTITSPLIPWTLCGAYMAGTLGVATVDYLPYSFFCWLCPLLALTYGFTGKFLWKTGERASQRTYRSLSEEGSAEGKEKPIGNLTV